MSEHEPGTDRYESEDYGTGAKPGHAAIVAERTDGSQFRVVDVNQTFGAWQRGGLRERSECRKYSPGI